MIKKTIAFYLILLTNWTSGTYQNSDDFLNPNQIVDPNLLPSSLKFLTPSQNTPSTPPVIWSILIATICERQDKFKQLAQDLLNQINNLNLNQQVELVFYPDNRQVTVGYKRNQLLKCAQGEYISFIDDDDLIHHNYVGLIYPQLLTNPDCVKLIGIMTQPGHSSILRIHSIQYQEYLDTANALLRPPTHLNPMRKSIASQFKFLEVNFGEDKFWTMQIAQSKLLKQEADICEPYYFYQFDPSLSATWSQRFESLQKLTHLLLDQKLATGHESS